MLTASVEQLPALDLSFILLEEDLEVVQILRCQDLRIFADLAIDPLYLQPFALFLFLYHPLFFSLFSLFLFLLLTLSLSLGSCFLCLFLGKLVLDRFQSLLQVEALRLQEGCL